MEVYCKNCHATLDNIDPRQETVTCYCGNVIPVPNGKKEEKSRR